MAFYFIFRGNPSIHLYDREVATMTVQSLARLPSTLLHNPMARLGFELVAKAALFAVAIGLLAGLAAWMSSAFLPPS
ncbi:MAG: hypothetical protein A3F68_12025 [Acidobacteria bacterium RIFCSPLOWO2_12_FULL_54_10]|nr:MAG: hypothetical protein A3F68_12025 [Acidobacteria bacterium RIFCSPLOWO2_12_FULL_54_10]